MMMKTVNQFTYNVNTFHEDPDPDLAVAGGSNCNKNHISVT